MINYELLIEVITALGIAFLSAMKYKQVKNGGNSSSPLLPDVSEGSVESITNAPDAKVSKRNIKAELDAAASAGVPFDFTVFGPNAVLDWNTGDIKYK